MFININNSWQTVTKMFVNVNGSWQSTAKGYSNINGVWQLIYNMVTAITDTFTRTTSGSLGTSDSGTLWNALRGVWSANGSQATSSDTASTYPIASATFAADATLSEDVSGGTGLAFWITDANNWWAAYPTYIQNSSTSSTCTGGTVSCSDSSNTCTPSGGCGTVSSNGGVTTCTGPTVFCTDSTNTCAPGGCGTPSVSFVNSYYCPNSSYPYLYQANCYEISPHSGASIPGTVSSTSYTRTQSTNVTTYTRTSSSPVSSTTYTYDTQVVVVSSVSGTITTQYTSTLVSGAGSLSTVGSLKVVTSGNQITTRAYTGTGLTTQLGSDIINTPASPLMGTSVGIIKAPSTYSQGTTLDNFSAT